ncbi:MAG: NTP transferase domain-containing protein [Haloglomus sp.]
MSDPDLPVVEAADVPADPEAPADRERVFGVLLAGGTSSRFGAANKLLADLDGEPIVARAARSLLDADLTGVVAVLGHEADRVRAALGVETEPADSDVTFVENPDYADGQATSVRAGVSAVSDAGADAAVFLPGDMPFVDPATVDRLVDAYRAEVAPALAAAHDSQRGNPVLFDGRRFEALSRVDGDTGGRGVLLGTDGAVLLAVDDEGVRIDIDTTDDLERWRRR